MFFCSAPSEAGDRLDDMPMPCLACCVFMWARCFEYKWGLFSVYCFPFPKNQFFCTKRDSVKFGAIHHVHERRQFILVKFLTPKTWSVFMLLMEEILHHHNGIKLPTSSGCPPQPSNRMSCLPTNHLKNLVDFGPFTRRESSVSQMAALGTKSTNNSEDELTCSIVISEGACPDLGGDLTGTVLNFFSGISHGIFFLEAVSDFFSVGGDFPWERCGCVFFATFGERIMGFLLALPTSLGALFGAASRMVRTVTARMPSERRRDFLTRHQEWRRPAGFFRPDVGIAFLRWNDDKIAISETSKSMFEGQFLHQLGCIVNSGINYQAELVSLHPGKWTWNPKMKVWKMILLFKLGDFFIFLGSSR